MPWMRKKPKMNLSMQILMVMIEEHFHSRDRGVSEFASQQVDRATSVDYLHFMKILKFCGMSL